MTIASRDQGISSRISVENGFGLPGWLRASSLGCKPETLNPKT